MINQAILSAWMKKHKIKFSVASNGQEAVEKWQGGGFHLVLVRQGPLEAELIDSHSYSFL
jgi:CheY-like chemotaxis protein